jgi:hypothetical protein
VPPLNATVVLVSGASIVTLTMSPAPPGSQICKLLSVQSSGSTRHASCRDLLAGSANWA